jgi:hypothetical protein
MAQEIVVLFTTELKAKPRRGLAGLSEKRGYSSLRDTLNSNQQRIPACFNPIVGSTVA